MENTKPGHPIRPGIDEALHPHTGNGAAWTESGHEFTLRVPDPLKELDGFFQEEGRKVGTAERQKDGTTERRKRRKDGGRSSAETPQPAKPTKPPKLTKAPQRLHSSTSQPDMTKPPQPTKPAKPAKAPQPDPQGATLSPFTHWLKNLGGSDYIHPYDDDFALEQAETVKEGISETYAGLLAAQGYTEQAIDMYKKLMEKNPEKSAFFAAKIKALDPSF